MAVIRYILDRSADDNPSRWNPAELHGPLLSDLLHRYRTHHVPVENEHVLRYKKSAPHSWRTYELKVRIMPKLIGGYGAQRDTRPMKRLIWHFYVIA